jgi:hypothetical protein
LYKYLPISLLILGDPTNPFKKLSKKNANFYEGETKDELPDGFGRLLDEEKNFYEGIFDNGKFTEGRIFLNFKAGDDCICLEGEFKPHELGKFEFMDNNGVGKILAKLWEYEGECHEGYIPNGVGKMTRYKSGIKQFEKRKVVETYQGEFKFGHYEGKGILTDTENNFVYEGEFERGKKEGFFLIFFNSLNSCLANLQINRILKHQQKQTDHSPIS